MLVRWKEPLALLWCVACSASVETAPLESTEVAELDALDLAAESQEAPVVELLATSEQELHAVGTVRVVMDVAEGRRIPVQLWYPAVESARAEAEAGRPVLDFEPPGPERDMLARATLTAGPIYSERTMHAADAPEVYAQDEAFPLVVISHCTDCSRFGYVEIAETLAAHGFVVAAPDHVQNTIYDYWNGTSVGLELNTFLETRRMDVYTLTDILLNPSATVVPRGLRGKIDPARVGAVGHSFGALTASYASTRDSRIRAVVFLAMIASGGDNLPFLGDELAKRVPPVKLSKPALFLRATEDLMQLFGLNEMIKDNYLAYPNETWLATMRDTGHYSVTNLCGLDEPYTNGCGPGIRTTQLWVPFTFLDIGTATSLTAAMVTTFMELQLNGASSRTLDGIAAGAPGVLTMEHRAP